MGKYKSEAFKLALPKSLRMLSAADPQTRCHGRETALHYALDESVQPGVADGRVDSEHDPGQAATVMPVLFKSALPKI